MGYCDRRKEAVEGPLGYGDRPKEPDGASALGSQDPVWSQPFTLVGGCF